MQGFERGRVITKEEASLVAHSFVLPCVIVTAEMHQHISKNIPILFLRYTNWVKTKLLKMVLPDS